MRPSAGVVVSFDLGIDNAIPISLDGHIILGQAGKKEGRFAVKVVAVEKEASLKIAPPAFEEPEKELEESLEHETIDSPISDFSSDDFDKFNSELSDEKIDENLEELPEEEFSEEDLEGSLNEDAEVAQDEESEEPTL